MTNETVALYHPRRDVWRDHFAWDDNSVTLLGLTPTGRATIHTLRLNRAEVVNFRRLLSHADEMP